MRISSLFSATCIVGFAIGATIVACGGSSSSNIDAAAGSNGSNGSNGSSGSNGSGVTNPNPDVGSGLGQLCTSTMPCNGSADSCVVLQGLTGASTTTGYCSPTCHGGSDTTTCSMGYTGPTGGMPQCALTTTQGGSATGCAIICTSVSQCPGGMNCV